MAYYNKDGIAIAVIHEGQRRGVSPKGIQITLSCGLVESNLTMYANEADPESMHFPYDAMGYDHNSVGVFQQRAEWWGTCQQRMDPAASAAMFYDGLNAYDYNSDAHTPGWYAQQVQQSAYPDRYDERFPEAVEIYNHLAWMECPHQPGECRISGDPGPLVSKTWMPAETNYGEIVLPYDHGIVPQETGYWCGPASTQVVLNGQGVFVSEQDLANEMGTHSGGTDYIGQIETVLDNRVPHMAYITVNQPYDPMSHEDKERLWANLVRSIADEPRGGVVMNWVAPPGNYPIGVKGSESPHYGGGTIYHYVACMGIDDNPDLRACWIADSGFYPFGFWCAFDQVTTLIPPKGYCYAATEPTGAPVPPQPAERLSYDILSYEQMCGPRDASGYGTGWAQLGQNESGANLYVVDALGAVKKLVEGRPVTFGAQLGVGTRSTPDYLKLDYEQLAGPVTDDGYGHGWPQLDGLSVTDAVASIKRVLEGGEPVTPPEQPPQPPVEGGRHALLTCSGTWAAPGIGFPSDVANGCQDVCEEIPVEAPWSFGPLGGAGDQGFHSPSYAESVQIGVDWAVDWLLARPTRTFMLGGYSQGGECAARIWQETQPGGRLESVAKNFIAGFTFGNPSRHLKHTFYAGPERKGEGIAEYRMPDTGDWWADEVEQGDMYGAVPTNLAGEIMRDVYTMCIEMEMHSGAQEFAQTFAANAAEVVQNLDGDAYDDVEETAATMGVDLSGGRRGDVSGIVASLRADDGTLSVKGIAAAIEAAIIAITFFAQGTRPHIEYHLRQVFPGQTYVQHAIQHVHHWANTRVPSM